MWCYDGWHPVADRLEARLPAWARLVRMDPSLPLSDQVARAVVLIPTTGLVDGMVIRAAGNCKLISQPAAGTDNISLDVAKELRIPVTNAPGTTAPSASLREEIPIRSIAIVRLYPMRI